MTAPRELAALAARPLGWAQAHAFTQEYTLSDGETPVGALAFRSAFGSFATAKTAEGCWTMKRVGFLNTRVEIRRCESDTAVGTFHNGTWSGGGTLRLPDGRELRADTNLWQSRYAFSDASGQPLVRYTSGGFFKASGEMEITAPGAAMPELPWIVMLGLYLVVMMRQDSTSAVVFAG